MAEERYETMDIPALGRNFKMGMFYDAIHEQPTKYEITRNLLINSNKTELVSEDQYSIIIGDDIQEKLELAHMDLNTQLSVVIGMLDPLTGSARYFHDRLATPNEYRLTLHRECVTHKETMAKPGSGSKNKIPAELPDNAYATHVVVGITYGVNSFTVMLDQNAKDPDNEEKLFRRFDHDLSNGRIIPDLREKMICRYFGDLKLGKKINTLADGLSTYMQQPDGLTKEKIAVPVRVTLLPAQAFAGQQNLANLPNYAPISDTMALKIIAICEQIHAWRLSVISYSKLPICNKFDFLKDDLAAFSKLLSTYEGQVKERLRELVARVRARDTADGKVADEGLLQEFIAEHQTSAFGENAYKRWFGRKKEEISTLEDLVGQVKSFPFCAQKNELNSQLNNLGYSDVVCLMFYEQWLKDPSIRELQAELDASSATPNQTDSLWFENPQTRNDVRSTLREFLAVASANNHKSQLAFVVAVSKEPSNVVLDVVQYMEGNPGPLQIQTVKVTPALQIDMFGNGMAQLSVLVDNDVNVTSLVCRYQAIKSASQPWQAIGLETSQRSLVINGLDRYSDYQFKIVVVGNGFCSESETLMCSNRN